MNENKPSLDFWQFILKNLTDSFLQDMMEAKKETRIRGDIVDITMEFTSDLKRDERE